VPGVIRTLWYWPTVLAALLALVALLPQGVSADSAPALRGRASELAQQNQDLAARSRSAVLQLYSLDSQLAREQARLVYLRVRTAAVKADLAVARTQLRVARRTLSRAERSLAQRLTLLYEQGDSDPLAIVLGATSVADALGNLDSMNRIADQERAVIGQTQRAKHVATKLTRKLAAKEHDLEALSDQARQSMLVLGEARSQRAGYLASLRAQQRLNASTIASLQQQALAVESRARQLASVASSTRTSPTQISPRGGTMTVEATGYAMHGRTATGAPTGWGVVAVDPSVIPLGTRLTIPGYGSGVAADTGSAIQGATIDLWFPTVAQARAWGRRTVTITLH
jgi:3D (Asp-Asp-Asp) domain-containing protein